MNNSFIQINNLEKSYSQGNNFIKVLKKINCNIEKGSICALLGPSGSGKSTLLNILGGIETYESGSITIDKYTLEKLSANELSLYRREELGFIFQFYNLISNLTVRENIEVGSYLSKDPLDVDDLLVLLGLKEHERKFPNQLSGGQQQRTSIGRALSKKPSLLICDEPTGALDYNTAKDVLALIEKINREFNTTIIIATHNTAIAKMSHRILELHDGRITKDYVNSDIINACDLEW